MHGCNLFFFFEKRTKNFFLTILSYYSCLLFLLTIMLLFASPKSNQWFDLQYSSSGYSSPTKCFVTKKTRLFFCSFVRHKVCFLACSYFMPYFFSNDFSLMGPVSKMK